MEEATEIVESAPAETPPPRRRIDWRTGKQTLCHPRSFWEEHERRRAASGLSISQYCEQHGLALSTLRRWSARLQGRGARRTASSPREAKAPRSSAGFLPMPIVPAPNDSGSSVNAHDACPRIEVLTRSGTCVRLFGETAERVMQVVMAELAGSR